MSTTLGQGSVETEPIAASLSPMVYGAPKTWAKARLWSRICFLAIRSYGSPPAAAAVLRRMLAARERVQRWKTGKYAHVGGRYFWNLYSPGWPSRAFDRYVERELHRIEPIDDRPPGLQTAVFAITKRCSYKCEHCCEWQNLNQPEALATNDLLTIAKRLIAQGATQIFLSGGEPLRRFNDLVEVIREVSGESDVWILSAGQGLSADRALKLRAAGLTGVSLSLDHHEPELHDRFRGVPGAYRAVVEAAAHCRAADLVVACSLVPTRNFVTGEAITRYARAASCLGASFVQLLEPKPVGRYAGQDVSLSLQQQTILAEFCDRANRDPACRDLPAFSYPEYSNRRLGCHGAGDRHLYIDTDGGLNPCPFCRSTGISALEPDFDAAVARLRAGGCIADNPGASHG